MGIKGELGDGFPQPKPAFIARFEWDAARNLGPTTQPKNNLSYCKAHGTIQPVPDGGFPPFAADFVDSGAWLQEEVLPSGQKWIHADAFALLKVIEPANTSADSETETGLVRMKWNAIGHVPETIFPHAYERNVPELAREILKEGDPGNFGVITCSFETGDQRYKYLEHAVYVGKQKMVVVPTEAGGSTVIFEVNVSYVAA